MLALIYNLYEFGLFTNLVFDLPRKQYRDQKNRKRYDLKNMQIHDKIIRYKIFD